MLSASVNIPQLFSSSPMSHLQGGYNAPANNRQPQPLPSWIIPPPTETPPVFTSQGYPLDQHSLLGGGGFTPLGHNYTSSIAYTNYPPIAQQQPIQQQQQQPWMQYRQTMLPMNPETSPLNHSIYPQHQPYSIGPRPQSHSHILPPPAGMLQPTESDISESKLSAAIAVAEASAAAESGIIPRKKKKRIEVVHTESSQQYPCDKCDKVFNRPYNLKSHQRTHSTERPHVCKLCGRAFARAHDRRRHENLHKGEKKFRCGGVLKDGRTRWGCDRRFARADALGRHFRTETGWLCIRPLMEEANDLEEREALRENIDSAEFLKKLVSE